MNFFDFLVVVFLILSPSVVFAQTCDYNASTTLDITNSIKAACLNPALYQVTICLQSSTPYTGSLTSSDYCTEKAFIITTPKYATSPAVLKYYSLSWSTRSLTLSNLVLDLSGSDAGTYGTVQFPSLSNGDSPSFAMFDVNFTGLFSGSIIFSLLSRMPPNQVTVSNVHFLLGRIPTLFSSGSNLNYTIDRLYISDASFARPLMATTSSYSSTLTLTNSVIRNTNTNAASTFSGGIFNINLPGNAPCKMAIINNTFENITVSQANTNILNSFYHSSPGKCSLLFQDNLVQYNVFKTNYNFPSQSPPGLFSFPSMDAKLIDNVFINNLYTTPADLYTAPLTFSPYLTNNATSTDNIIKPIIQCPNGFFLSSSDDLFCTACSAGSTSTQSVCALCAPGTFSSTPGSPSCTSCSFGYASLSGASSCTACLPGSTSSPDRSSCTACLPGTYTSASASPTCLPCLEGYTSTTGANQCQPCPTGMYSAAPASPQCYTCPINTYQNKIAQPNCLTCPLGSCAPAGSSSCQPCD